MNILGSLMVIVPASTAIYFGIRWLVRVYFRYRGTSLGLVPKTEGLQSLSPTRCTRQ